VQAYSQSDCWPTFTQHSHSSAFTHVTCANPAILEPCTGMRHYPSLTLNVVHPVWDISPAIEKQDESSFSETILHWLVENQVVTLLAPLFHFQTLKLQCVITDLNIQTWKVIH